MTTKATALFAGLVGLVLFVADPEPRPARAAPDDPPNVVVVTTDDQSYHTFNRRTMPKTFRRLVNPGTRFRDSFATPPLCCPARAGFLTGQYAHNHGVEDNRPGYPELEDSHNVLPHWLREEGYRTGFVGKYLNGTTDTLGKRQPAPGWDSWFAIDDRVTYYGPTVWRGDERRQLPPDRYLTDELNRRAGQFVKRSDRRADNRPFFLWVAHFAPHVRREGGDYCSGDTAQPLARDLADFRHAKFPKRPNFNERDIDDKPPDVASLDRLDADEKRQVRKAYRCAAAAMRPVDRGVAELIKELADARELDDTIVVFTSDNGTMFGEHRLRKGKGPPYEEVLAVPLIARVGNDALSGGSPDVFAGPVGGIDLAPTLVELAGAEPCRRRSCRTLDGRSLVQPLTGGNPGWTDQRGLLIERLHDGGGSNDGVPFCRYLAIRTSDAKLIRTRQRNLACADGAPELYDLGKDPYELENRAHDPAYVGLRAELDARMEDLASCTGIAGRDPAPPPGRSYCE